jgi:membrane fusion protein, heavy metal efflux system
MRNSNRQTLALLIAALFFLATVAVVGCGPEHQAHADHDATHGTPDPHDDHAAESADEQEDHDNEPAHSDEVDEHAGHDHATESADEQEDHDNEPAHSDEVDEHAGHDHGAEGHGGEDLDQPVDELFAAECEHGIKTYACDECRYEVGVVKVPADLIDRGLISVANVAKHDLGSKLSLTGEIQFNERKIAHLGPRVPGVVRGVNVDIGRRVKAGQTLLVLESIDLAEAQAAYLEALAELRLTEKSHDRQKELHKQKITSEKDFLQAQQELASGGIRTNSAKQKLLRLGLSEGTVAHLAKSGLSAATGRLPIVAPFNGEVLELHAVRGERVEPGDEMVLFGDTTSLWVWIDVYESQLATIKATMTGDGLPVTVSVRAWPEDHFAGRVDFVGNVMDRHTRTVKARVVLENAHGKLSPGMFANVALDLNAEQGRPAAPATAIVSDEGRDFVFVRHHDDFFVRRAVTTGRQMAGFVELLDGVELGQTIVANGTFLLKSDVLRSKMGAGCAH